jgi:long-chain acyl-CoA synthetase
MMFDYEKRTIKFLFESSVKQFPDELALSYVDEDPFTYKDVDRIVQSLKKALIDRDVEKGDRVAILSENCPQWGMIYFAVASLGAVNVPILPDFHKSEVHHILRNSGAKILFISSKLLHKLDDSDIKNIKNVVCIDNTKVPALNYEIEFFDEVIKEESKKTLFDADVEEDDLVEILYTSGTTGHSKGVMLTNRNIVSNALAAVNFIEIVKSDRLMSILPMAHSYECTCGFVAPVSMGAKIFYIKGLPTAQTLLPAVEKIQPTIILSVPLIMEKIYKKKVLGQINEKAVTKKLYSVAAFKKTLNKIAGKKLYKAFGGKLKFMVFGGAATPPEVEEFLTQGGFPYTTGYGLTESSPLLTANPLGQVKMQSAGKVVNEVRIRIDDPDPETGIGEIVATGPNIMQGYYKNEEATKSTFTSDGWLKTGDRGYIDDEGYLFIKGRSKNIIVGPSGENIFPEEIEFYLAQSSYALESLVYESNGKIVARIFLDYDKIDAEFDTHTMDESQASEIIRNLLEEIRKNANKQLASFKRVHQVIEQTEEFEKTPTKKIKRYLYTA